MTGAPNLKTSPCRREKRASRAPNHKPQFDQIPTHTHTHTPDDVSVDEEKVASYLSAGVDIPHGGTQALARGGVDDDDVEGHATTVLGLLDVRGYLSREFGVWGLGFRVRVGGSRGFGVWSLGSLWTGISGNRAQGPRFMVCFLGFMVWGLGSGVWGAPCQRASSRQ